MTMAGKAVASAGPLQIQERHVMYPLARVERVPTMIVASSEMAESLRQASLTGLNLIDPADVRYVQPTPSAQFKKALSAAKKLAKNLGVEAAQNAEVDGDDLHPDEMVCMADEWWYNHGVPGLEADEVDYGLHFVDAKDAFEKGFVAALKKRVKAGR